MKIAIIYASFNEQIVKNLLKGALQFLKEEKIDKKNIKIIEVPGVFEIPLMCKKLTKTKKYDGIITLGCIIKGQTEHYDMLCQTVTDSLMQIMLEYELPIIFEILMVHDIKYAIARTSLKNWNENKGYTGARTLLEVIRNK